MSRSARALLSLLPLILLHAPLQADERLDTLKNISAAGAPLLTLKMLDQAQPGIDHDLYAWCSGSVPVPQNYSALIENIMRNSKHL